MFAIGGTWCAAALLRGRAALLRPTPASFALGLMASSATTRSISRPCKLAPPAEASLITSLWALLTVLFSGLLPGHRLRAGHIVGALLGLSAATMLVWDKLGAGGNVGKPPARLCAGVRLRAGLVELFRRLAPTGRCAERKPRGPVPGHIRAGVRLHRSVRALGDTDRCSVLAGPGGPGDRPARRRLHAVGHRHEGGNVPLLGVLSYASLILSTALLVALGLAQATWSLAIACGLMVVAAIIATRAD